MAVLDAGGALVRLGTMDGTPVDIETLETTGGPIVLLATDKGEIRGYGTGE